MGEAAHLALSKSVPTCTPNQYVMTYSSNLLMIQSIIKKNCAPHPCCSYERCAELPARPVTLSVRLLLHVGEVLLPGQDTKHQVKSGIRAGNHKEWWRTRTRAHLEGKQQRCPFFTPQVRQDRSGHDREHQAHQDPNLKTWKHALQLPFSSVSAKWYKRWRHISFTHDTRVHARQQAQLKILQFLLLYQLHFEQ